MWKSPGKMPDFLPEDDILACIRSRPILNLTKSVMDIEKPTFLSNFGPVVDGTIVINDPNINLGKAQGIFVLKTFESETTVA